MINLVVDSQEIRLYGTPTVIADGSVEFVAFQFVFSPEWAGYVKVAQFIQAGVTTNIVVNPDDTCYLPPEIGEGTASLSVFGQAPNLSPRATTNKVSFQVLSSGLPENPDIPPSPDLYAQLIGVITDAKEYVVGVEEDIQQAILEANQAAELTEQAVSDAELAAQAANQAAELADGAAGRANSAADLAEQKAAEAELAKTGANSAAQAANQAAQTAGQATTEALAAKKATETAIFNAEMHTARAKNAADTLEPIIAQADQALSAVPGALSAEVQRVTDTLAVLEQTLSEVEEAAEDATLAAQDANSAAELANAAVKYTHIRYANSPNPADGDMSLTLGTHLGVAVTNSNVAPTSASVYTWNRIRGDLNFVTFDIDLTTGELYMMVPDNYSGPMFYLNEATGSLEVSING